MESGNILLVQEPGPAVEPLEGRLSVAGFKVTGASSTHEAVALLEQGARSFDVVLVDQASPDSSPLDLLRRLKEDRALQDVRVIVRGGESASEGLADAIKAGSYYYLTKPCDDDMLRSVVRAAAAESTRSKSLRTEVGRRTSAIGQIIAGTFEFRTLTEARNLSTMLSLACPEPERVAVGLSELLVNAVEHGNLGIGYAHKSDLLAQGRWQEEVERRLSLAENAAKVVRVEFQRDDESIHFLISDQGEGFDPSRYLEFDVRRALDRHGRGIAIAGVTCFDRVRYLGRGNQVLAILSMPEA